MTLQRAYSLIDVKSISEDKRVITGTATTPNPDRMGDIVEPLGVKFKNPLPLLWQHRGDQPVGTVRFDKPTKDGITFTATLPKISEPPSLKDRVDTAWAEVKAGLVRAVSIGFRDLEVSRLENGGLRFIESEVLELSLVTIPANAEAVIDTIRSFDIGLPAATGQRGVSDRRSNRPGVTGQHQPVNLKGPSTMAKTPAEQMTALEEARGVKMARMKALLDNGDLATTEQDEFDTLEIEVKSIDNRLRLLAIEAGKAKAAKPIIVSDDEGSRGVRVEVRSQKAEPGIRFARIVKAKMAAQLESCTAIEMAQRMYGRDSETFAYFRKSNEVFAGGSGTWADDLIGDESGPVADFVSFLRPATILGKFGQGGIPALRSIPFRVPLITQSVEGAAYWVGEGKGKPLTAFDFTRTTLEPLKVATISVLTEEAIRDSRPSAEALVRDGLRDAIVKELDTAFILPGNNGGSAKPPSVTYAAPVIASTGTDVDSVDVDVRAVFQKFIDASNPPSTGVWVMSSTNALALSLMKNGLGQREFPGISMMGGTFQGLPVIVSDYITSYVVLINAGDIYLGDEGGVRVDMSREASLEMKASGFVTQDSQTGVGASMVSMFQTNSVAIRAERTINWSARRPDASVAYLSGVVWGGAVPAS